MADEFVTIGEYGSIVEAQLARDRLRADGIAAFVFGEDLIGGLGMGIGGAIRLQVPAADAPRAAGILASCLARADDEPPQERGPAEAVWLCPLCGEPVPVVQSLCPFCETQRGDIQAVEPGDLLPSLPGRRRTRAAKDTRTDIQEKKEELTPEVPARSTVEPPPAPAAGDLYDGRVELPPLATFQGDDLAERAYRAALFGLLFFPLTLYSLWLLLRLAFFPGDISPGGMRRMYIAVALNLLVALTVAAVGRYVFW
jgi:hypothetical protein